MVAQINVGTGSALQVDLEVRLHTPFEPDPVSKKTTRDLGGMAMLTILGSIRNTKFENPISTMKARRAILRPRIEKIVKIRPLSLSKLKKFL